MLVCRDVTELVSDYIERSLPPQRRFGVWLHLLHPRYIDQMRKTMRLLARGRFAPPPSELEDRLIAGPEAGLVAQVKASKPAAEVAA